MAKAKIALVTGASSGIGKATAIRLAKDGFRVWAHYNRNEAGVKDCIQQIEAEGGSARSWQADLSKPETLDTQIEKLWQDEDQPDLAALVNNAGLTDDNLAGLMSFESFDKVLKTNAYGPFMLMKYFARKMMKLRSGSIVNVTSLAGQAGNPGQINYSASKAALIGMTKSLAKEIGARNVRVNAVAPGFIETEMIQDVPHLEMLLKQVPLGRVGRVEEVSGAISFLCSEDASYINGHVLSINGGLYS